jgi:exonuclease SbcD
VDFGEADDKKGVLIVDAAPGTPSKVRFLPLTAGRRLQTLRGTIAELSALAEAVGDDLLRVIVRESRRPGLAEEVREILPNAVEVRIDLELDIGDDASPQASRTGRTAHELFAQFLTERGFDDPRLGSLFAELYDEAVSAP